jgi:hypothetical protein
MICGYAIDRDPVKIEVKLDLTTKIAKHPDTISRYFSFFFLLSWWFPRCRPSRSLPLQRQQKRRVHRCLVGKAENVRLEILDLVVESLFMLDLQQSTKRRALVLAEDISKLRHLILSVLHITGATILETEIQH